MRTGVAPAGGCGDPRGGRLAGRQRPGRRRPAVARRVRAPARPGDRGGHHGRLRVALAPRGARARRGDRGCPPPWRPATARSSSTRSCREGSWATCTAGSCTVARRGRPGGRCGPSAGSGSRDRSSRPSSRCSSWGCCRRPCAPPFPGCWPALVVVAAVAVAGGPVGAGRRLVEPAGPHGPRRRTARRCSCAGRGPASSSPRWWRSPGTWRRTSSPRAPSACTAPVSTLLPLRARRAGRRRAAPQPRRAGVRGRAWRPGRSPPRGWAPRRGWRRRWRTARWCSSRTCPGSSWCWRPAGRRPRLPTTGGRVRA